MDNQPSRNSSAKSGSRVGSASSSRRDSGQAVGTDGFPQLRPTSANSPLIARGAPLQEVDVESDASNTTLPPINDSVPLIQPTEVVDSNILGKFCKMMMMIIIIYVCRFMILDIIRIFNDEIVFLLHLKE